MKTQVIILAGGKGTRMKASVNKTLLLISGIPVIIRSINAFIPYADSIVIAAPPDEQPIIRRLLEQYDISFPVQFADGGHTRQESVLNCLQILSYQSDDTILIHDAARCLVKADLIERVIHSVQKTGSGIPGIPVNSTYKVCNPDGFVVNTPMRSSLYEIQTPQGFKAGQFIPISLRAASECIECTDDAGLLEHYHLPVRIVPGDSSNLKITEPADLERARNMLKGADVSMRIGMGYDVHQLAENRKLILCGVEIPFEKGLLGHSDADVAVHALMDALLGAAALGDIGHLFPDTSPEYEGISSMILLEKVTALLRQNGYALVNADLTIVAQRPKLAPYISEMRKNIAAALFCDASSISVKATTTESLGFEGRQEGISAQAVCLIQTASADQSAGSCIPPEDSVQGMP